MVVDTNALRSPSVAIKVVQIVLLIIAVAMFGSALRGSSLIFAGATIIACFINAVALLVCFLLGYNQIQQSPLELGLYTYYTLAIFITSILLMTSHSGVLVASGVFCLILTPVYGVDTYLAFMNLSNRPVSFPPSVTSPPARDGVDGAASSAPTHAPAPAYISDTNPTYPSSYNYPPNYNTSALPTPTSYNNPAMSVEYPTNSPIEPKA